MDVMRVGRSESLLKSYPEHQHGYWEVIFNVQGTGIMTVDGTDYIFEPGDITVIPPNTLHKKEAKGGFTDICMFIKNFRPVGRAAFRILRDDDDGTVRGLMEMACKFYQGNSVYELAILNVLGDLIYQVLVLFYVKNQRKDPRLEGIIEIMHNNLNNAEFNLSEAIDDTGYCKGYFRKIFKEFTGDSPVNYFQEMRINYAKSLMNQYDKSRSIKDIAASSGFKDPLYFSRIFKKIEGMSPRTYMQQQYLCDDDLIRMDEPAQEDMRVEKAFDDKKEENYE